MRKFALSDVDPVAITLCKQGANRQRIFLRKSAAETDLLTLPAGHMPILKSGDDWTAFYCVVAAPGAEEDPGLVGDRDSVDVWADESEIRKAAHRLLKNGAYVNTVHDGEAAEGCAIVESAVALADLPLDEDTIPKGAWYVGIEPADELRKSIDDGDIDAVSLEGTGLRTELAKAAGAEGPKAKRCPSCSGTVAADRSTCQNCGHTFKLKKAKDDGKHHHLKCPKCKTKQSASNEVCKKCGHSLVEARKAMFASLRKSPSFDELVGVEELRSAMWRATSTLESVIWQALSDEDEEQPAVVIRRSLDEFTAFLASKLDVLDDSSRAQLAKQLGSVSATTDEEDPMGLTEDFAALKKQTEEDLTGIRDEVKKTGDATTAAVNGLVDLTGKLVERVEALSGDGKKADDDKTDVKKAATAEDAVKAIGELADSMDAMDVKIQKVASDVRDLASGDSSQADDDAEPVKKSKDPLAGLLA
jgi:hypothetical protein